MKLIQKIVRLLLLVCISTGVAMAEDTKKPNILNHLSQQQYHKVYAQLNTVEKQKIDELQDKRKRIYALATKEKMHHSSEYKEYMDMVGKDYAMNLFLQKHRDDIVVSKKELQGYYDAHKQDYTSVHAYTLVRKNKKELDVYLEVLKSSSKVELEQTFMILAKKHSQHPSKVKGGDMGFVGYSTIVKPFGKETFALKENSYTIEPFKTVLGWHIVYAKEQKVTSFEKVKKSIEDNLKAKMYVKWFKSL